MISFKIPPNPHQSVKLQQCLADFFFSSRRRHTIFDCDWSSDVCSSDLLPPTRIDEGIDCADENSCAAVSARTSSGGRDSVAVAEKMVARARQQRSCVRDFGDRKSVV